jgi:hypothetical protein
MTASGVVWLQALSPRDSRSLVAREHAINRFARAPRSPRDAECKREQTKSAPMELAPHLQKGSNVSRNKLKLEN